MKIFLCILILIYLVAMPFLTCRILASWLRKDSIKETEQRESAIVEVFYGKLWVLAHYGCQEERQITDFSLYNKHRIIGLELFETKEPPWENYEEEPVIFNYGEVTKITQEGNGETYCLWRVFDE